MDIKNLGTFSDSYAIFILSLPTPIQTGDMNIIIIGMTFYWQNLAKIDIHHKNRN